MRCYLMWCELMWCGVCTWHQNETKTQKNGTAIEPSMPLLREPFCADSMATGGKKRRGKRRGKVRLKSKQMYCRFKGDRKDEIHGATSHESQHTKTLQHDCTLPTHRSPRPASRRLRVAVPLADVIKALQHITSSQHHNTPRHINTTAHSPLTDHRDQQAGDREWPVPLADVAHEAEVHRDLLSKVLLDLVERLRCDGAV
jgi:hypothetical protein